MSYYNKPYYHRRYYRNKNSGPDVFDMLADIIIGLVRIVGTLIFWLFKAIFNNRNKIKGLFKLNEKPIDVSETNIQIQNNINQISESEKVVNMFKENLSTQGKVTKRYDLKESQLTESEKDFFEILRQVVGDNYRIEPQVQLSSIIRPTDADSYYTNYSDFNKIKAKSIDFVLFDKTFKPQLAIELDDRSHFQWKRMRRDQFVNDLMESVGLRIIHVPVSYSYDTEKIKRQIFTN